LVLNGVPCSAFKLNQIVAPVFFSGKYLRVFRKTNNSQAPDKKMICFLLFQIDNYGCLNVIPYKTIVLTDRLI